MAEGDEDPDETVSINIRTLEDAALFMDSLKIDYFKGGRNSGTPYEI